jgi:hypothetical protein
VLTRPKDRDAGVAQIKAIASPQTRSTPQLHSVPGRSVVDAVWTATGHERPVFLDERGRRRRWVLAGGMSAGAAAAFWFAALVAGAIGFSTLPSMRAPIPLFAQRAVSHDATWGPRRHHVILASGQRRPVPAVRPAGLALGQRRVSTE